LEFLFPEVIADLERELLIESILHWAVDHLVPRNNLIIFTFLPPPGPGRGLCRRNLPECQS